MIGDEKAARRKHIYSHTTMRTCNTKMSAFHNSLLREERRSVSGAEILTVFLFRMKKVKKGKNRECGMGA